MGFPASLRTALTFKFILVALIPLLAFGGIALRVLGTDMERELADKNLILVKTLAGEVDRFLEEPMNFLIHTKEVLEQQDLTQSDRINNQLASILKIYRFFDTLMILDHKGLIRYLAPEKNDVIGFDMSSHDFFMITQNLGKPYWSPTFISMQTDQPTITLSLPLGPGMLVGYVNLSVLNAVVDRIQIGSLGYAVIVDQDGTAIAHPDRAYVAERVNLKNIDLFSHGFEGKEGSFRYRFMGEDTLSSIAIVSKTHWMVAVIQPVKQAFAPIRKIVNIIWAGTLVAVALALVIALFSLRMTLKPLLRLTEDSNRIAGGDYTLNLQPARYREIDNLQNSYMAMINAVKDRENEIRMLNQGLEQRVSDRTAQLEAANKELEAFAYSVSHDLRAPLRHIDGFMDLLQKKVGTALDDQSLHYMDVISEAAQKMGLLIDDLLSFSRMGRHAMSAQPVALEPLVHNVIRELEPDAAGRDIDWRIGDLPEVSGDAAMLRIVLVNLIANALKFTRPRQQARIEIGSLPGQTSEAVIYVGDNGVGFDMTYADKLFGVFQRVHRADEFEGTGIGLAMVHRIICRHGGRTWAEGKFNQGATFYFSLPADRMP
jgi:signal transduction histidine kinase